MNVAYFLSLLGVCLGLTLEEWLHEPNVPVMSSGLLRAFVPPPVAGVRPYAFSRFSLGAAAVRVLNALAVDSEPAPQARPAYINNVTLEGVSDKYRLGMTYLWSLGGVERDIDRAYEYFLDAATNNEDLDAMFMVGVFEATGFFFTRPHVDTARAILFYTLAADGGSLAAQLALGFRYTHGLNVPQDSEMAAQWLENAGMQYAAYIDQGYLHPGVVGSPENPISRYNLRNINRNSGAFGAETNTGLYGKHNYRVRANPTTLELLSMGDRSTALKFVQTQFSESFETLEDAFETLAYRAVDEHDPRSMYGLALIYKYGASPSGEVDWEAVASFASMCERTIMQDDMSSYALSYTGAASLLGECYLWGSGRPQNTTLARHWFRRAVNMSVELSGHNHCFTCQSGIALCDLLESTSAEQTAQIISKFETTYLDTASWIDPNIAREISRLHFAEGDFEGARKALLIGMQATNSREPMTLLQLAFMAEPMNIEALQQLGFDVLEKPAIITGVVDHPVDAKLNHLRTAFYASESVFTLVDFAQYSYDMGDLDSAVIAYAVSAELGARDAQINLADLFDIRHSYLGVSWGQKYRPLRALSEWPLPSYVEDAIRTNGVNRAEVAVTYFSRAAQLQSVDALAKLVEYGWHYGLVPAPLVEHYLSCLEKDNMAIGHWWRGQMYYTAGEYQQALNEFSHTLVNPDAWMPAKFSQFLTACHLLRGDSRESAQNSTTNGSDTKFSWSHVFESYRGIIVKVEEDAVMKVIPGTFGGEALLFALGVCALAIISGIHALRR